ncbi:hypothetical protein ESA94_12475 [Lacibacter luteus]|uniref:DUF937 domain-containing protein n=1 Tax=Lacibacter luteus TaxID=2508719 RepID=A0A4Q1CHQ0_9BACT|nr:hypothetical protein [Lacibacter luteus]RXK59863.1 hypothetical protein ESA94_12475 [Lacibacter luteus]
MFDQLLNLVKQQAGTAIIDNPDIPNERNDEAVADITNSITGGLQQALAGGQFKDVLKLLGGKGGDVETNPLAGQLSGNAISSLMEKFNLNQGQAGNIVSNLLPGVLNKFISKTNDPSDNSVDLQGIFSSLTGGSTNSLDIQGLLGRVTQGGLDKDGDGDTDFNDIINMVKGGASQQSGGGGVMDMVKGLFG